MLNFKMRWRYLPSWRFEKRHHVVKDPAEPIVVIQKDKCKATDAMKRETQWERPIISFRATDVIRFHGNTYMPWARFRRGEVQRQRPAMLSSSFLCSLSSTRRKRANHANIKDTEGENTKHKPPRSRTHSYGRHRNKVSKGQTKKKEPNRGYFVKPYKKKEAEYDKMRTNYLRKKKKKKRNKKRTN
jgi:hypothetical protein